jgi:small-conductance mechanosensitive channel
MVFLSFLQQPAAPTSGSALGVVLRTVRAMWTTLLARLPYVVIGTAVVLAVYVIGRFVRRAALLAGQRTRLDVRLADLFGTLAVAGATILGLLVASVVVFPAFQPGDLVAGLGITSVAVGFAFKDILQNFFAGILILLRHPFRVGDQIRSREFEGTVEEINVRSTRLETYDGERVMIPNGDVYTNPILVRTAFDRRRVRFTVGIGFPDSIEDARAAIHRVLAGTEGVLEDPGPWVYVEELAASSVNFAVYFWAASEQANVLRVRDRAATAIKLALDEAQIDMPFPHAVVLFHDQTGARPEDRARTDTDDGVPQPAARGGGDSATIRAHPGSDQ